MAKNSFLENNVYSRLVNTFGVLFKFWQGNKAIMISFIKRALKGRGTRRLKAGHTIFMRRTAGYSLLDRRRNEDILEEINVDAVREKLVQYKQKWLNNVNQNGRQYTLKTIP
jgi:hypothetical protein